MKVLWNGQIKHSDEAVISPLDHGFLYGMGLFETLRTYGGLPWLLERHAARLAEGCRTLGIAYEPDPARMRADIDRLREAAGLEDAYIRWSVSAGEEALGLPSGAYARPNVAVYAKALAPDDPETRSAKTVRLLRLPRATAEGFDSAAAAADAVRLKSFHYMNNIFAKRELAAGGAAPTAEGLFLNAEGRLCEGIVSNVFWVSGGVLHTPALAEGPLPGITRAYVLGLAAAAGLATREGRYRVEDAAGAEEMFLTNSIQEIVPVAALEDADGRPVRAFGATAGETTRRLMRLYRQAAESGGAG